MQLRSGGYAAALRLELCVRNHAWAAAHPHVESYGSEPVIVYMPREDRHGNFYPPSYESILANRDWARRFDKVHAQGRSLPKMAPGCDDLPPRRWRELDSSMSSDALLMNIFCAPGVAEDQNVRHLLGIDSDAQPIFGWKARVPLASGRFDRTEVDMRWGNLLVEAKLTENDFQTQAAAIVEAYRDFDAVFERELLPRAEIREARRKAGVEFAEEFTQEWEEVGQSQEELSAAAETARAFQSELSERAWQAEPSELGYRGYQLIRNVLAAYAEGASFCVMHDERRPDLREMWFTVMSAVKSAEMRTRCKVLTWQELAMHLPEPLQAFLEIKYGIVRAGQELSFTASEK